MAVNHDTVYLKGDRNVEVQKKDVTLGDIVAMECSNKEMIPKLKTLKILKIVIYVLMALFLKYRKMGRNVM